MKTVTANELLDLPDDGFRYELVACQLRKMPPPGLTHAWIISKLIHALSLYMDIHPLGRVLAEFGYLLAENPDTVLAPDVSFLSQERLESADLTRTYWIGGPDLAVEVVSPSDRYTEVDEKIERWVAAGTRLVWVVDPRRQQVAVYRAGTAPTKLTTGDTLDGGDVVPGWTLPVRDLFA